MDLAQYHPSYMLWCPIRGAGSRACRIPLLPLGRQPQSGPVERPIIAIDPLGNTRQTSYDADSNAIRTLDGRDHLQRLGPDLRSRAEATLETATATSSRMGNGIRRWRCISTRRVFMIRPLEGGSAKIRWDCAKIRPIQVRIEFARQRPRPSRDLVAYRDWCRSVRRRSCNLGYQ
jgi:hypothetical protein